MKKLKDILKESNVQIGKVYSNPYATAFVKENEEQEEPQMELSEEQKKAFLEAVKQYKKYGEAVYRNAGLGEVYESIKNMVEMAGKVTLSETDDWFDNVTVSRHMKRMGESFKVFEKTLKEVSTLQQRLEASYDEIGEVLGKYYEISEELDPVGKEDGDIDNDGDEDASDEYLANRRKVISKAMKNESMKLTDMIKKPSVNEASNVPKFKKGQKVYYTPRLSGFNPKTKLEIIRVVYEDGDNFTSSGWYYSFKNSHLRAHERDIKLAESVNEASEEFVVYVEKDNGRKKLLHTKQSQRAANMFLTKNADKILNQSGVRSIGSMSKDQWEKDEAQYAENIKKADMKTVTKNEWDRKHKDYKGMIKGQPYMMWFDKKTQSTVYGPVNIKESVNEAKVGDFEIGDFIHFKSKNKTGMVVSVKGNTVTINTPKGKVTGDIKDVQVLYQDNVNTSVKEAVVNEAKYDIGMARKGNGITVYNRAEEESGDYKNVAHISDNGTVKYYDKKLPNDVKKKIEMEAQKMKESKTEGTKMIKLKNLMNESFGFGELPSDKLMKMKVSAKEMLDSVNPKKVNEESVVNEATAVVDTDDPKSPILKKLLKKHKVTMVAAPGFGKFKLTGPLKGLKAVLQDEEGWGINDLHNYIEESVVTEGKVIVYNEKTGERYEVLSGSGKGDLLIAMNALQKAAPSHMKYSIK